MHSQSQAFNLTPAPWGQPTTSHLHVSCSLCSALPRLPAQIVQGGISQNCVMQRKGQVLEILWIPNHKLFSKIVLRERYGYDITSGAIMSLK